MSSVNQVADLRVHGDVWDNVVYGVECALGDIVGDDVKDYAERGVMGAVYAVNVQAVETHVRNIVWEAPHG
ncbi:MAG: hypothetical protein LBT97_03305 [Planctomycetota bacterium]|jgi:hypothetical protein|nr:hypothetical protein [Planctomycetota bacterium]